MRHRFPGLACRALLFLLLSCLTVQAQSASTAQLNGSVKDQSGAALPGVTVTVTQTDDGLMRTAVTDESGSYVLQNLPVGPYRFEAALQGFRTYAQTGIVLRGRRESDAGRHARSSVSSRRPCRCRAARRSSRRGTPASGR